MCNKFPGHKARAAELFMSRLLQLLGHERKVTYYQKDGLEYRLMTSATFYDICRHTREALYGHACIISAVIEQAQDNLQAEITSHIDSYYHKKILCELNKERTSTSP